MYSIFTLDLVYCAATCNVVTFVLIIPVEYLTVYLVAFCALLYAIVFLIVL